MAASVTFRQNKATVKGVKADRPVPILIAYYNNGISIELSTGHRCHPNNFTGSRVKDTPIANQINKKLAELEYRLLNIQFDFRDISQAEEARIARCIIKGEPIEEKKTVEPWIEQFIESAPVKDSTKQVYRATFAHIKAHAKQKGLTLTWDSFNLDYYESLTSYLYKIGHNDNTVGKTIKTLKTFIREAFDRDQHSNISFKKKSFRVLHAQVDEIYLNEEEIEQFHNADISSNPGLIDSKKLFVFGCYVGLRFSDLSLLTANHIVKGLSGYVLKVTTKKTGEDVIIPFHPIALEIWQSWGGIPPKQTNPDFNKEIKEIAALAHLDRKVQKRNTVKGQVKIKWVEMHKMVKAHTCRRSFATNCYLMDIPNETIMAITGHKTEKAFRKYIRITKEEHAATMQKYFNKPKELMQKSAG